MAVGGRTDGGWAATFGRWVGALRTLAHYLRCMHGWWARRWVGAQEAAMGGFDAAPAPKGGGAERTAESAGDKGAAAGTTSSTTYMAGDTGAAAGTTSSSTAHADKVMGGDGVTLESLAHIKG